MNRLKLIILIFVQMLASSCLRETKNERYAREARETTAQCPMAIDANTVMDSMTYTLDTHRFTYYYKVRGVSDSILIVNKEFYRQQILERLLNSPNMIPYIEDKVSFRYIYRIDSAFNAEPVMDFLYDSLL